MVCCIVGLGNPGSQYQNTRHNIGFDILESLVKELGTTFHKQEKFLCDFAAYKQNHSTFYFVLPQTFMNLSGESVLKVKQFYKPDSLIIIHDDLDLPLGSVRFKKAGGSGGHNGIKSIDQHCGNDYYRMRIGIGRSDFIEVKDYVLGHFNKEEILKKDKVIEHSVKALQSFIKTQDFTHTQNHFTVKG